MGFKRQHGEDGSDNSCIANNSQSPPTKFRKMVNFPMKEVCVQELAMNLAAILEPFLRKVVKEEVEPLMYFLQSYPRHSRVLLQDAIPTRTLKLTFTNKLPSVLFTNSKVEDQEHNPLQIQLIDSNSNTLIQHGPLSAIKVEIFVLSGDFASDGRENWTENEFNDNIVREREGKRPLLVGDLMISTVGGIGSIENVTFTDNSSWIRSRKFKLGVRVVSGCSIGNGIREAVTEAFVVLDHRGESYQKHHRPSLDDPIWRLKKISKQGASHKRLEAKGIKTVKDFLMHYNLDKIYLRSVLGKGVPNKTWETMLKHANECLLDNTYYSYETEGGQLLFNCVYKVVCVKFVGQDYQPVDALDKRQKLMVETMKQCAFSNLDRLVPVLNPFNLSTLMPLEQHVPCSSSRLDLPHDALSIIDQGEPEKQLDMNLSDSASYPCIIKDCYFQEGDSTSQNNQQIPEFTPTSFFTGGPGLFTSPSDGTYNWSQNCPIETFTQSNEFGELSQLQSSTLFCPFTTNWGQGSDYLTTSTTSGSHIRGTGKSRARWCKIRAAVMWKVMAAKRKTKLPFTYF